MKFLVVAAALLILAPAVSGAAFMKLGDIKGEAMDSRSDHKGEIDVLAWSWGMTRERDGSIAVEPVEVHINSSGGEFWFTDLQPGSYDVGDMVLGVTGHDALQIHVQGAGISSYHVRAEGNEVREEVSFYYNKISFGSTNGTSASDRTITFTGLE